jgi:hypothetical protein
MTRSEHPLIAAQGPHTSTYLIGECLEAESAKCSGQAAGEAVAGPVRGLGGEEDADGFFVAPAQEAFDTGVGDASSARGHLRPEGQVKAMNGIEKEERPNAIVEIVTGVSMRFEVFCFRKQL